MAKNIGKTKFILYLNQKPMVDMLSDEQCGILFKQIFAYCNDENPSDPSDKLVNMAWQTIKAKLKEDLMYYKNKCEINKANSQAYWSNKEKKSNDSDGNQTDSSDTKGYPIDRKNERMNDKNDIEEENTISKEEESKPKRKVFVPPTPQEVDEYCKEKGYNIDAEYFVDFYAKKGWMVGKTKMVDWKAGVRTWVRGNNSNSQQQNKNSLVSNNLKASDTDII